MKTHAWAALVLPLALLLPLAEQRSPGVPEQVVPGRVGLDAFIDLGRYYGDTDSLPPYENALDMLSSPDTDERAPAASYLLALFRQSLADEDNGRAPWRQTPFWGGGAESSAWHFRELLAKAFGRKARGEEALPVLAWILEHEPVSDFQIAGMAAIGRIGAPHSVELLRTILAEPHPNGPVLLATVEMAGRRAIRELVPEIGALAAHHRASVRTAARAALGKLEVAEPPAYDPVAAFPAWLAEALNTAVLRVLTPITGEARWGRFYTESEPLHEGRPWVRRVSGWRHAEDDTSYQVLSEFGSELDLPKRRTRIMPQTLAEEAERLLAVREGPDAADSLSAGGSLTAQFEPGVLSVSEVLVTAWSLERGDTATAANLILPRIEELVDDRHLDAITRTLLGHHYHHRMLEAFSYDRDYPRTIAIAEHLSKTIFDGYAYQGRAKELRRQLSHRSDDFRSFALPDSVAWLDLQRRLDRPRQIAYLAERLRLLNCFQAMQPGGVSLNWDQFEEPWHKREPWGEVSNASRKLINPYLVLNDMEFGVDDLPALAPFLADTSFMPTFEFWRDFNPSRHLFRVMEAIEWFVNGVAQWPLVDADSLQAMPAPERQRRVAEVITWSRERQGRSPLELRHEFLRTTESGREFYNRVGRAVSEGDTAVVSILLARIQEFPEHHNWLIETSYRTDSPAFVPLARKWVEEEIDPYRGRMMFDLMRASRNHRRIFFAALILLRHGRPMEGYPLINRFLREHDREGYFARLAHQDLLRTEDPRAVGLLCEVVQKPGFRLFNSDNNTYLRRLVLAGCEPLVDSLLAGLESEHPAGTVTWLDEKGFRNDSTKLRGDLAAEFLSLWRGKALFFDGEKTAADRARERDDLRRWFVEQIRRIRVGEPSEIQP